MKILGLILEINPFHTGHKYFIEKAIELSKPDVVIAVTSTSFTMRGDVSLLSKFDKTRILLKHQVDIVMELPVSKTLNSADFFAYHSIETLVKLGITDLAFGLEDGRKDLLNKIFEISESDSFQKRFVESVRNKNSYKNTFTDVFREVTNDDELLTYLEKPNFTLGLQYLKALKTLKKDITIHTINRVDNFYNNTSSEFQSAYTLRKSFSNNQDISKYLPYDQNILKNVNYNLLYDLIKYKFLIDNQHLNNLHMATEGIENYIIKNMCGQNLEECMNKLCNKRYTKSRFMRLFISSLLNINKNYNQNDEYYRILGFNEKGRKYINTLPKSLKNNLKTSLKNETNATAILELRATKLYCLLTNQNIFDEEFKIPIKL